MVLVTPAELGHVLLHATRHLHYLLIHIDIRTLTIKDTIWCPRAACLFLHARARGCHANRSIVRENIGHVATRARMLVDHRYA